MRHGLSTLALVLMFWLPLSPGHAGNHEMSRPEFNYVLTASAENMVARLYVNGAPLILHARLQQMRFTFPVTEFLRAGKNTITVDFEPINQATRNYTPHAGVAIELSLEQRARGGSQGEIDLFSGQYDEDAQTLAATGVQRFSRQPLRLQAGTMSAPARYSVTPVDMNYPDRASGEAARRLSLIFMVADPSLGMLPQDGAPVIEDGPALRQELHAAYAAMHAAVAAGDVETYRAIMAPVLERAAYVLGYEDTAALLESVFAIQPFGPPEGATIRPMPSLEQIRTAHLGFGAEGRMVEVTDSPISYVDAGGQVVGALQVMFCRQPDGALRVCHQQDIPH